MGAARGLLSELAAGDGRVGQMVPIMANPHAVVSGFLAVTRSIARSSLTSPHEPVPSPAPMRPSGASALEEDPCHHSERRDAGTLLILNYDVKDERAFARYRAAATEVIEGDRGQVLVSTSSTTHLAEAPRGGTRTVVIWYPSRPEAERCYWSIEYQSILPDRIAATSPHVALLVDLATS